MVGSARDFIAPVRRADDVVVCVNGSAVNVEAMGVNEPAVTLLLGHMLRRTTRHSRATFDTLRGRSTGTLFCLSSMVPMQDCLTHLANSGFSADWIGEIDAVAKAALTGAVFGEEFGFGKVDERVSNGVLAIACTLIGRATEVILCGFSFGGGHSYTEFTTRRLHVRPDHKFLTLCASHPIPVRTTSRTLADECGLALAAAGPHGVGPDCAEVSTHPRDAA